MVDQERNRKFKPIERRFVKCPEFPYTYDDAKRQVIRQLPNGVHSTFTFGNFGELKSLLHADRQQKLLREYRYYYGADRQVQKIVQRTPEHLDITTYAWHASGRIEEIRLPDGTTIRYQYNEQGRCISRRVPRVWCRSNMMPTAACSRPAICNISGIAMGS